MRRLQLLSLVSCALFAALTTLVSARPLHVTFINPGDPTGFWGDVVDVMNTAALQLDIELEVLHAHRDRIAMISLAQEVAQRPQKPDVAIIVNELQQGQIMLRSFASEGVPVYFLLNKLDNAQHLAAAPLGTLHDIQIGSIVPDNWQAGYEMLQELVNASRPATPQAPLSVLAILGDQVTPAALDREAGMRAASNDLQNVRIERAVPVLWDPITTLQRVRVALNMIEFDLIWAANDDLALAALEAVKECGDRCRGIQVAGLNWSSAGLDAVARGDLVLSHGGHFLAGGIALSSINNYWRHAEPPNDLTFGMTSINASNHASIAEILIKRDWSDLNFTDFASALRKDPTAIDPLTLLLRSR